MPVFRIWLLATVIFCAPSLASDVASLPSFDPNDTAEFLYNPRTKCVVRLSQPTAQTVEEMIEKNEFGLFRSLHEYQDHLGDDFWAVLRALNSNQVWFDSGAGALVALSEFLTRTRLSPHDDRPVPSLPWFRRPKAMGLVYRLPPEAQESLRAIEGARQRHRFTLFQDEKIETFNPGKVGKVDLLTDVMGPFSYTDRIDLVLNKYLELVPVGGHIFILTATLHTKVTDHQGYTRHLSRYLKRVLAGHEVTLDFQHSTDPNLLHIRVTEAGPKILPPVRLKKPMKLSQPPERHFIEDLI